MAISEAASTSAAKPNGEVTVNNAAGNEEEDEKPRTLFVGNVPRDVHKREIEEIFGDVGPLKRCYIQYPRDGNEKKKQREDTTVAYVTFALSQDATKALETLQSTKIGSNRINIKFAKARNEQVRQPHGADSRRGGFKPNANFEPIGGIIPPSNSKDPRPKPVKKKSRLIVRNLSFKVTEEKMKEYFEKFGAVKEVNILKKPSGKLVGCAFIQYQNIYQAAAAIKELNMKPFLGRPIAIDWALPKEKYQTDEEKQKKKEEQNADETIEIKDEPQSEAEDSKDINLTDAYDHLKEEPMEVEEIKQEESGEVSKSKAKNALKRKSKNSSDEDEDDEEDDDSSSEEVSSPKKRPKQLSNDVEEGKTLFLRNLSFDTKEDDMKQFFEKFGELHYALLCKDRLTEHPKGTGFIKFKLKSAADECLQQYENDASEFRLSGRQFNVSVALSKERIENKSTETQEKKTEMKPKADSRNLYLVREGFIRPGSSAANDVSQTDMNKRASLNKVKKQMLKNLNIIISPTRLCVHNLPLTFTDKQLRNLFKKHGGPGAKIIEARIMRDMNDIDLDGKGKSKGFGFVNFKEHEHALTALRTVNNNPSILNPNNRPIVEFSMENRLALRAKEKRAIKSREKNPNTKNNANVQQDDEDSDEQEDEEEEAPKKPAKPSKKNKNSEASEDPTDVAAEAPKYSGLKAKKGVQSVPSFKPKGKITRNSLKQKRSKRKNVQERKQREPKVPSKRPVERVDKTEKMISKHRQKLRANDGQKKKKWFE